MTDAPMTLDQIELNEAGTVHLLYRDQPRTTDRLTVQIQRCTVVRAGWQGWEDDLIISSVDTLSRPITEYLTGTDAETWRRLAAFARSRRGSGLTGTWRNTSLRRLLAEFAQADPADLSAAVVAEIKGRGR